MKTFKRVLVPTDFSEHAERALKLGECLARQNDAELLLLHVLEDARSATELSLTPPTEPTDRKLLGAADDKLKHLADRSLPEALEWRTFVSIGHPAAKIVEVADDEGVDLICMGTLGRTGLKHLLVGSIAEKVVRHANCAVMTVKHS